jgi:hypothetical protein
MQRILFLLVSMLVCAIDARADYFQVFDAGKPYYIPHATVLLNQKAIGSTDAAGRIRIDLPPGTYSAEIAAGQALKQIRFTIDNGAQLKRIEAL